MIAFAQISDRIGCMRPDKLPREWQIAFQISARRLAAESLGLQEVVEITVAAGDVKVPVYTASTASNGTKDDSQEDMVSVFIFKAESYLTSEDKWRPLPNLNQRQYRESTLRPEVREGTLFAFTEEEGLFLPYHPPEEDTQVRLLVAYKPIGDFDEVGFGPEFEDALVEGALSHLLRLPGTERSLNGAETSEIRFLSMAGSLKGQILIGDIGYTRASSTRHHTHFFRHTNKLRW